MCRYEACFGQELHKIANRRHCTGMHYVEGMVLLVGSAYMGGWGDRNTIRNTIRLDDKMIVTVLYL